MMLDRFENDARRLLQAGWTTGRVRDWAISAASGYGSLWQSPKHALVAINDICRAENRRIRRAQRSQQLAWNDGAARLSAANPVLAHPTESLRRSKQ